MSVLTNMFPGVIKKVRNLLIRLSLLPLNRKKLCIGLLLLIIIVFGFGLRFYELSERPFLADEGISTMAAVDISKTGYPPTMPEGDAYWRSVFHTSTQAVFFQLLGISVFVARIPSVLFGTLTILLIYFFGKELVNWKVGAIAAFLLSVNVLAIDLSREARMYAFFQFFYLLSLYIFYKGFEAKRGKTHTFFKGRVILENIKPVYLAFFMVAFVISFLCHEGTVMIILGIIGYAVILGFLKFKQRGSEKRYLGKYLSMVIFLVVMSIAGYLILKSTYFGRQYLGLSVGRDVLATNMGFNLGLVISSIRYYGIYILEHFPLEFSFAVIGLVILVNKRKKNGAFILSVFLIPLFFQLIFFHYDWLTVKYIFHLIPLFLVLSAFGINEIAKYFRVFETLRIPENTKPRFVCILLCLLIVFTGFSYAILATQRGKIASPYWREACEYVLINSKNDTSLIASVGIIPHFYLESDEYGLRPDYPEHAHKNITIYDRPYLHTRKDLENFTRTHDNGWVLIDMDRWNWEEVITKDAKLYLQENMTFHPYKYHMHLLIYSWGYE